MELCPLVSMSPSQIVVKHRVYCTPQRLFLFRLRPDAKCPRCWAAERDLIHMVWRCQKLYWYWGEVLGTINSVFGTSLDLNARLCVLSHAEGKGAPGNTQIAVLRCLFQARKLIAHRWQSVMPPTCGERVKVIKETSWKEKFIYIKRGNLKQFEKIWKLWLDVKG